MKLAHAFCIAALLSAFVFSRQSTEPELAARAQKANPPINGELQTSGLEHPVKVMRDNWGVAHIYAANQHDLFFAQGFVAAQDRLFQMELWKRAGQGRLAEVLGKSAIERDRYARLLKYRGDFEREYKSYSPDTLAILTAFTNGINAYIRYLDSASGPGLPISFQLAGFKPEPWKPEDCLSRMAAYSMTGNAHAELRDAELLTTLGAETTQQILDPDPPTKLDAANGVDYSGLSPKLLDGLIGGDTRMEFALQTASVGSNNWTISGKLTSTSKPILANDPHRVIAVPSLRYIVHLSAPGWDVIGAGEPALPGVAIGHNQHIAWGLTIFGVDQQDLYVEELNPDNPLQYKRNGKWELMRTEKTVIAVKDGSPQTVTLKFTQHSPVLWEDAARHRALALRWVGSEPGTAGYLASLAVDRAQNWNEFLAALERWKLPPENMVYADTDGNIGEQSAGLTPIRSWTGLLPVLGSDGNHEWSGFVPLDQLPRTFNPAEGWFATANNRTIPEDYKYKVGFEWATYRIERIRQVLSGFGEKQRKIRMADVEDLQRDVYSLPANELIPMLPRRSDGPERRFLEILKDWDRLMRSTSVAAALYEVWENHLRSALLGKIAGASAPKAVHLSTQQAMDCLKSLPPDEQQQVLLSTLLDAGHELEQKAGTDPALWSWGSLHTMTFRHALDQLAGAKPLFDLGPVARPGDANTVNATGSGTGSFQQSSGASYREIFDLSNFDNSLAINTPGQSGEPGSRHYSDLLPLWEAGQYFPLLYSKQAIEENATDVLTLVPEKGSKR
ncbi:MAG TPA: penicillin acylase family protein [Terriglobales bacterium]|jgi:penicillin amidase|nr:penicillin acylase family protein [Terriglobales bacterium]